MTLKCSLMEPLCSLIATKLNGKSLMVLINSGKRFEIPRSVINGLYFEPIYFKLYAFVAG